MINFTRRKRLRVFTNISSEDNEIGGYISGCISDDLSEEDFMDLARVPIRSLTDIFINDNENKYREVVGKIEIETNHLVIHLPSTISKNSVLLVLNSYGELKSLKFRQIENKTIINAIYYDLRHSSAAFKDRDLSIKLEDRFGNNPENIYYKISYAMSKQFYDDFFLSIFILKNETSRKIIDILKDFSQIDEIYEKGSHVLVKFYNLRDKEKIKHILSRITPFSNKIKYSQKSLKRYLTVSKDKENNKYNNDINSNKPFLPFKIDLGLGDNIPTIAELDLNIENAFYTTCSYAIGNNKRLSSTPFNTTNINSTPEKKIIKITPSNNKENKKGSTYKIIFDKKYTGIQKRNTPSNERKQYVINVDSINAGEDKRTTLMIKNIPVFLKQTDLIKHFFNSKYQNDYDFFYLPIDFCKNLNAGYAFINFKNPKLIVDFFLQYNNNPWNIKGCPNKTCFLSYARIQGFSKIAAHFARSSIMKQVDDKVKPIILY